MKAISLRKKDFILPVSNLLSDTAKMAVPLSWENFMLFFPKTGKKRKKAQ